MGRWHHMHDIPLFLRCSGCDKQSRVSEVEHYRVRQNISESGWICTEEGKTLCPSCAKDGPPSDIVTIERLGEMVKKQWDLTFVRPISRAGDVFYFSAAGFNLLRTLSITVTHDSEHGVYNAMLYDGTDKDLGNVNTAF